MWEALGGLGRCPQDADSVRGSGSDDVSDTRRGSGTQLRVPWGGAGRERVAGAGGSGFGQG